MKKVILLTAIFMLVCVPLLGAAEKPLVDPTYKEVQQEIEAEKAKTCKKIKNISKRMKCGKRIVKAAREDGRLRGTEEYCEKNYIKKSKADLDKLWRTMLQQQKTARRSLNVMEDEDRHLGELTQEDLQTEIEWVESRLARMQKEGTEKLKKGLDYKNINNKKQ